MAERTVLAGQEIALRARFLDDTGVTTTATSVFVHIFEPGVDTSNIANAILISGVTTSLGQGIFEYNYTVPALGPAGVWSDQWEGDITFQSLNTTFGFTVIGSGVITSLGNQLFNNNVVLVTVVSGIKATSGVVLDQPHEFQFMTVTSPSYTNLRKVHLEAGGFISSLFDDTVQLAILEASLEVDILSFNVTNRNLSVFQHARRQYVTCLASYILVNNLGIGLKSKTLGDLRVEYDTNSIRDSINRFAECMARWEAQVIAGGAARSMSQPIGVVKGELDPDRPIVSRSVLHVSPGDRVPAANTRVLPSNRRRFLRAWTKRPIFKKYW